jgi:hypothetical protein
MPNIDDTKLGPTQVVYDGTDIGWTLGGVTVRVADSYADLKVDQHGNTILDKINSGTEVSLEIPFAELSLDNLGRITGVTPEVSTGSIPTEKRVTIGSRTGCSLIENAKKLILKPMDCGVPTTDTNEWITMPLAAFQAEIEDTFDPEGQRVWKATAHVFPDVANNMQIIIFGTETFTP